MSENKDLLDLLNDAIEKKLRSLNYKNSLATAVNAGVEKKSGYINHMESTSDQTKQPMSLTKKTLLGAGALAAAAGMLGVGKLSGNLIVKKKQAELALKGIKASVDEFTPKIKQNMADADRVRKSWLFGGARALRHEGKALLNKNIMEGKFYKALEHAGSKETEFRNNLPKAITGLDGVLVPAGLAAVGLGMYKKSEYVPIQATKESQDLKKVLVKPNLLREPVNYSKGFQCGPIIENADKMDKIAEAVNSLFPKSPRGEPLPKADPSLRLKNKIGKQQEALAQHEMAHQEKDMKLKELQKAIKKVNGHAQHYRSKAIEHFTNSLDAEVAGSPGR